MLANSYGDALRRDKPKIVLGGVLKPIRMNVGSKVPDGA
jgi:hypothetical protein